MSREFYFLFGVVILLTLAVGALGGYLLLGPRSGPGHLANPHLNPMLSAAHSAPELPPRGIELARGWMCVCGACKDKLLECHCDDPNGAHEIKAVIRDYIAAGLSDEQIREEVVKKYGPKILGDQPAAPAPTGLQPPAAAEAVAPEAPAAAKEGVGAD